MVVVLRTVNIEGVAVAVFELDFEDEVGLLAPLDTAVGVVVEDTLFVCADEELEFVDAFEAACRKACVSLDRIADGTTPESEKTYLPVRP